MFTLIPDAHLQICSALSKVIKSSFMKSEAQGETELLSAAPLCVSHCPSSPLPLSVENYNPQEFLNEPPPFPKKIPQELNSKS